MLVAHELQPEVSLVPVEQIGCEQVPPVGGGGGGGVPPPLHWLEPQIDETSLTHCASHAVAQQ